jgi:hypothetical protein
VTTTRTRLSMVLGPLEKLFSLSVPLAAASRETIEKNP